MFRVRILDDHLVQCDVPTLHACRELAAFVADALPRNTPIAIGLVGTLGAGKTQWVRSLAQHLGATEAMVSSPTFVLVQHYPTDPPITHLDAYRVGDEDEFLELGIEEMFDESCITVVEWADRFRRCMPKTTLWIELVPIESNPEARSVTLSNLGAFPELAAQFKRHSSKD
ncbi:MAG: tRNA (adenosine(37)-N6)-threonylcarbamoyltransferase complex ATPase subunit type 1 TsaE [Pirellula sp.]|jgi:tRNA threonylcarbamoyladenosine biosynthesis protein TsaE